MSAKHTRGPWRIQPANHFFPATLVMTRSDGSEHHVATLRGDDAEDHANQRLILFSPDLRKLLQEHELLYAEMSQFVMPPITQQQKDGYERLQQLMGDNRRLLARIDGEAQEVGQS